MPKQRDIVLVPVPFTDLTSQKKRPVIVISNDNDNNTHEDVVVVAVTSNIEPRDFTIMITNDNLEEGSLKVTSMVRVDKVYTLNQSIIIKTFGRVKPDVLSKIKDSLLKLIEHQNASN